MLISPSSLDTAFAERIMTSGRFPCIIDEDRFEVSHHYFLLLIQDEEQVAKEAGDARQDRAQSIGEGAGFDHVAKVDVRELQTLE
jgi:hypothetical protein